MLLLLAKHNFWINTLMLLILCYLSLTIAEIDNGEKNSHPRLKLRHIKGVIENVPVNVEWLTDEQLSELSELDSISRLKKIQDFYNQIENSVAKKAATQRIVAQCYDWLPKVSTEEERMNIDKLHEAGKHNECKIQIAKFMEKLPEEKQTQLHTYWRFCEKVWYESHEHMHKTTTDEHNHHHNHSKRDIKKIHNVGCKNSFYGCFDGYRNWMTHDEKEELKILQSKGASQSELVKKIFSFYDIIEGPRKRLAIALMEMDCRKIFLYIFGKEKSTLLSFLRKSGYDNDFGKQKIAELIKNIRDPKKKAIAIQNEPYCKRIFKEVKAKQRIKKTINEPVHSLEEYFKGHLSWLSDQQKELIRELKANGKSRSELQQKVFEFYEQTSDVIKEKATELLKGGCKALLTTIVGEEKANELKGLKESGATNKEISDKVDELIDKITDENKKVQGKEYAPFCKKLFNVKPTTTRIRRHHEENAQGLEDYLKSHLSWLSDEQKNLIRSLKTDGKSRIELQKKIFEFYEETTGEVKEKARELLKNGCRELLTIDAGEEKVKTIQSLKESGVSHKEIAAKVLEFINGIQDEAKKSRAKEYQPYCKKLYNDEAKKMKRNHKDNEHHNHNHSHSSEEGKNSSSHSSEEENHHHHHHNHTQIVEDYLKTTLSWLTDEQKEVIRSLKNEKGHHGKEEMEKKALEFYEQTTGEVREKATQLLEGRCREVLVSVVGEEKANEIKTLKESGASLDTISNKVDELLAEIQDEHKKHKAKEIGSNCKKLFSKASRMRRHREEPFNFEDHLKTTLSWLTDEQKKILLILIKDGMSKTEIQKKVIEFYEHTTGDVKEKATELLQNGCRALITSIVGEDKANELKKLKESGATNKELSEKVEELITGIQDESKKYKAKEYGPYCKKLFNVEAKKMKRNHKDSEHHNHSHSHSSEEGKNSSSHCSEEENHRHHHHHHNHTQIVEDYLKTALSWLTDEQKEVIRSLKNEKGHHGKEEMEKKALEFYEQTTGEVREKATQLLEGRCREALISVVGEDKANEIKTLKESGSSLDTISNKVDELLAEVQDEHKKHKAKEIGSNCKKLFSKATRMRRHQEGHKHDLEDYFKSTLSWLTDEQKNTIRAMKSEKKTRSEIQQKGFEFYEKATGEVKEKATELLKNACRQLLVSVIGVEKAKELKALKEAGASYNDISDKAEEWLAGIQDDETKMKAKEYGPYCKNLFNIKSKSRMRRSKQEPNDEVEANIEKQQKWLNKDNQEDNNENNDHQINVGEERDEAEENIRRQTKWLNKDNRNNDDNDNNVRLESNNNNNDNDKQGQKPDEIEENIRKQHEWLNNEQKEEIRQMKESGTDGASITEKMLSYLHLSDLSVKGIAINLLSTGCEKILEKYFGSDNVDEIRQSNNRINELAENIEDSNQRQQAIKYGNTCRKVFSMLSMLLRKKREVKTTWKEPQHKLNIYLQTHLSWLKPKQQHELQQLAGNGASRTTLQQRIFEYYSELYGDEMLKAKQHIKNACWEVLTTLLDMDSIRELMTMRNNGVSELEIGRRAGSLLKELDEFNNHPKWNHQKELGSSCRKVLYINYY